MGLLDRDYYRDDRGGYFMNWLRHGRVSKILAAAYIALFLIQIATSRGSGSFTEPNTGPVTETLNLQAEAVLKGQVWRLLTYGFLHTTDSLWYIAFNVVLLYYFGREVEERMGWRAFLFYYLLSIVAAGLAFVGTTMLGLNGTNKQTVFVGATGAITAVLVLLACQQPGYRLNLFYVLPAPVWVFVLLNLGVDAWMMLVDRPVTDGRRMALALHFGGAVMASLYFLRTARFSGLVRRTRGTMTRQPPLRIHEEDEPVEEEPEERAVAVAASRERDEHLEAQLDAVLAKVAQHGKQSLTPSEHAILQRAAEIYRKRLKK